MFFIDFLPSHSMESIYRQVAGAAFERLPEAVRRAHGVPLSARGEVDVRWSGRPVARIAARAMGLPREAAGMPLKLEVRADGSAVVYDRWFGDRYLRSVQDADRGLLREKAGPATFHFRLDADAERLVYRSVESRVFGVPLPGAFRATVGAVIEPREGGWRARVSIDVPGLGRICEYEARMGFG